MAHTISEVMTTAPVTVDASTPIRQVAEEMRDRDIGDVLVTDENGLCGMVTDRDIVIRALPSDSDPSSMRIGDICSRDLVSIDANDDVDHAVQLMRDRALRRLPVTRNGDLVGVVSIGDLARSEDQRSALADISAAPPNT